MMDLKKFTNPFPLSGFLLEKGGGGKKTQESSQWLGKKFTEAERAAISAGDLLDICSAATRSDKQNPG